MNQYEIIVLDLDGTLTNRDKVITPKTKKVLLEIQRRGKKIVLASGRPTQGVMPLAKELELDRYGSYILPDRDWTAVFQIVFSPLRVSPHIPLPGKHRVHRREKRQPRPGKHLISYVNRRAVKENAVKIKVTVIADIGIASIVKADTRLHTGVCAQMS